MTTANMTAETTPAPRKRGRPHGSFGSSKYGFEKLQPGDSHDVPYEGPTTVSRILTSAKQWARIRGIEDARFTTMAYRTRGVVRIFRRR